LHRAANARCQHSMPDIINKAADTFCASKQPNSAEGMTRVALLPPTNPPFDMQVQSAAAASDLQRR
jgi:hypothetical protein